MDHPIPMLRRRALQDQHHRSSVSEQQHQQQQQSDSGGRGLWKPRWDLLNDNSKTTSDERYQQTRGLDDLSPSQMFYSMQHTSSQYNASQFAKQQQQQQSSATLYRPASDPNWTFHHQYVDVPSTAAVGEGNGSGQAVFNDLQNQMIWQQFFQQFRRYAANQEEFEEYKRLYLGQFKSLDDHLAERQFTNMININDPLSPNRDEAIRWVNGMDDMVSHWRDRNMPRYQQFGDPMADMIHDKAFK